MLIHNADITGSLTINGTPFNSGSFSGSFQGTLQGVATTASHVEYTNIANLPTLVSGSSQITYLELSAIPSGIVSASAQIADLGFATTGSNAFDGSQIVTGSLTVTGDIIAQTLNVQQVTSSVVYSSGSNVFGNSLANTHEFTGSLSVTGSLLLNGNPTIVGTGTRTADYIPKFASNTNQIQNSNLISDASGNLGLGVTPSAFADGYTTFQFGLAGAISNADTVTNLASNWYINSIFEQRRIKAGESAMYQQASGSHLWRVAGSASADSLITWNQAMTLTAGGRLGVGTTDPNARIHAEVPIESPGSGAVALIAKTSNGVNDIFRWFDGSTQLGVIKNNGNVGIGTPTPSAKLDISTDSGDHMRFIGRGASDYSDIVFFATNNTTRLGYIDWSNTLARWNVEANIPLVFLTNATERLRITSAGDLLFKGRSTTTNLEAVFYNDNSQLAINASNTSTGKTINFNHRNDITAMTITSGGEVGIGVNPTVGNKLWIRGTSTSSSDTSLFIQNSTPSSLFLVRNDGLVGFPKINDFTTGNSPNTWINPSSSYGIYINTSSIRYKKDIVNYDKGLTVVNQLRPVYYKGKSEVDGDKQFAGFIAEEIDELGLIEFVNYLEDGRPNSLSYPNMVVLLTKSIQELSAKVETLEAEIQTLKQ